VTDVSAVRVGDDPRFVAHVFRENGSPAGRVWVCVRGDIPPIPNGWVGCWSSKDERIPNALVDAFVRELAVKISQGSGIGPFGPFLGDHYFFGGWDTWGLGTPMPLGNLTPKAVIEASELECELEDFQFGSAS
jgi:hypothetical protein